MTLTNKTIWFPEPHKAEIREEPVREPGEDEILVRTSRTLVSTGTEMTAYCRDFLPGTNWEKYFSCPYKPGYNNVGTVVAVGKGVDESLVGKRVATLGNHAAYVTMNIYGGRSADSDHLESSKTPKYNIVPDGIDDDDAVFFTIAEIVMNGVRASRIQWGECAAVYGLGLLGQFATRFMRLSGAFPVFAVDLADHRLGLLPDDPAIIRVNPSKEPVADAIARVLGSRKVDVVLEVTGNSKLLPEQARQLRQKGRLVLIGSAKRPIEFNFEDDLSQPSISIIGAHNYSHPVFPQPDYPWTISRHIDYYFDLLKYGQIDVKPLVGRKISYLEAPEAYVALEKNRGDEMGVIFDWTEA